MASQPTQPTQAARPVTWPTLCWQITTIRAVRLLCASLEKMESLCSAFRGPWLPEVCSHPPAAAAVHKCWEGSKKKGQGSLTNWLYDPMQDSASEAGSCSSSSGGGSTTSTSTAGFCCPICLDDAPTEDSHKLGRCSLNEQESAGSNWPRQMGLTYSPCAAIVCRLWPPLLHALLPALPAREAVAASSAGAVPRAWLCRGCDSGRLQSGAANQ